jgi:hypothetical protein
MNYHLSSLTTALCIAFAILAPCRPATAQLATDEVNTAVNRIDYDLSSPFARIGLEKILLDLYEARIKLAPHRVETNPDWQKGFMKSFSVVQKRLHEGRLEKSYRLNRNVIELMQTCMMSNEHANSSFLRNAREQFPQLRDVPISTLQRSQTYFSIILALEGMDEWNQAARASYVFPFCLRSY